jgi:hypothetical protein
LHSRTGIETLPSGGNIGRNEDEDEDNIRERMRVKRRENLAKVKDIVSKY